MIGNYPPFHPLATFVTEMENKMVAMFLHLLFDGVRHGRQRVVVTYRHAPNKDHQLMEEVYTRSPRLFGGYHTATQQFSWHKRSGTFLSHKVTVAVGARSWSYYRLTRSEPFSRVTIYIYLARDIPPGGVFWYRAAAPIYTPEYVFSSSGCEPQSKLAEWGLNTVVRWECLIHTQHKGSESWLKRGEFSREGFSHIPGHRFRHFCHAKYETKHRSQHHRGAINTIRYFAQCFEHEDVFTDGRQEPWKRFLCKGYRSHENLELLFEHF